MSGRHTWLALAAILTCLGCSTRAKDCTTLANATMKLGQASIVDLTSAGTAKEHRAAAVSIRAAAEGVVSVLKSSPVQDDGLKPFSDALAKSGSDLAQAAQLLSDAAERSVALATSSAVTLREHEDFGKEFEGTLVRSLFTMRLRGNQMESLSRVFSSGNDTAGMKNGLKMIEGFYVEGAAAERAKADLVAGLKRLVSGAVRAKASGLALEQRSKEWRQARDQLRGARKQYDEAAKAVSVACGAN